MCRRSSTTLAFDYVSLRATAIVTQPFYKLLLAIIHFTVKLYLIPIEPCHKTDIPRSSTLSGMKNTTDDMTMSFFHYW